MTVPLGAIDTFQTFPARSHAWAGGMNDNMRKAALALKPSVKARVSTYPGSPSANDTYLNTSSNVIGIWTTKNKSEPSDPDTWDWHEVTPVVGTILYVQNERKFYLFSPHNTWDMIWDLDGTKPSMARTISAYVPGFVAPHGRIIVYVPTIEFHIPAGAPGSKASLEVPPTGGDLVLNMNGGTITFANGSTTGVFSVPNPITILPSEFESLFSQPGTFTLAVSGYDTYNAMGLSVTIEGQLRSIHVG